LRELLILGLLALGYQSASAQLVTERFGTGANAFTIDFVTIGNPGNAADTSGRPNPSGAVGYIYNMGKYEISREMVIKANQQSSLGITLRDMSMFRPDSNDPKKPATGIDWWEAAKFVNWLNTNTGHQEAYKFDVNGNFQLWNTGEYMGSNKFRHKDAYYFLPNTDEWYKAAYFNPQSNSYHRFPTSSNEQPDWVISGTSGAVYHVSGPSDVDNAGALSPYGTMAQGGNVSEWEETSFDLENNSVGENRGYRGGSFISIEVANQTGLESGSRGSLDPVVHSEYLGFRVASVPEPSALSLLAFGLGGWAVIRRRRS
jgi:formylglycine-generating enzyme required for sulfatase activity